MKSLFKLTLLLPSLLLSSCIIDNRIPPFKSPTSDSLVLISEEELTAKLGNKESFVLILASSTCQYCTAMKPVYEEYVAKYHVSLYYSLDSRSSFYEELDAGIYYEQIPNINIIYQGVSKNYLVGTQTFDALESYLGQFLILEE